LIRFFTGAEKPRQLYFEPEGTEVIQAISMVPIPAGGFLMGKEQAENYGTEPVHPVTLNAFQMSATEITQARYEAVMRKNPSPRSYQGPNLPVLQLSWPDAARFCNKLSELAGFESCYNLATWDCDFSRNGFRLPTEAEWEYACRAGTATGSYLGDEDADLERAAWYADNSDRKPHAVAGKVPNASGLYDMLGNAQEWSNDWLEAYREDSLVNPTGPVAGDYRILRGGSWNTALENCMSWNRNAFMPDPGATGPSISQDVGFRVVRRAEACRTYALEGKVLSSGGGLGGVTVQLLGYNVNATCTTGPDGGYGFSGLADGSYLVRANKTGCTFTPDNFEVDVSGSDLMVEDIIAEVKPLPETFSLKGSLAQVYYDLASGISGATATLAGENDLFRTYITQSDGHFEFNGLPAGTYTVGFIRQDYSFIPETVKLTIDQADVTLDVINSITLVSVPQGSFMMGGVGGFSEPAHQVTLDEFQIGVIEVTQGQYEAVTDSNPSFFSGNVNRPVERVTWYDAAVFCNKLSELVGLEPCYDEPSFECDFSKSGFRLPTEAEWEYACRAGSKSLYYDGDYESDLARAGWYTANSRDPITREDRTHRAALKEPNAWGLYDILGNVWEWCNDSFGEYRGESQTNPAGPADGRNRVIRGGGWRSPYYSCRSSSRSYLDVASGGDAYGFRIVRRK
ncbi:MAG: SUMF1/EgtB/PvdO family nonheme iron enzyme, partial [Candidatus Glassbacteria bacterium]|nr:SUMF1/EgtB/PvdO family nonheme iron enzyme [Candidatus Glassbacteria bacterium]